MINKKPVIKIFAILCAAGLLFSATGITASASKPSAKELNIAANQAVPVESNQIVNWPTGPVVSAESAILIELETGVVLYEKNVHAHQFPASTTKILTTLIAAEECTLDETVKFSHDAVFGTPADSNHIAMNEGDTLSMELCLQAILIRSANEVSYAVAEHISGTWDAFADKMNARAQELGCVDSHFVNPNGLPDEEHYTSAYDLAMIGRAFFSNEMLCQMTLMPMLHVPKKNGDLHDANQMALLPGKQYAYDYLVGCKTGYTDVARYCLVSCAEKNGMKLVCVVLKDESPYQYEDTIALFNYGFGNFEKVNVSQAETKYNIDNKGFYSDNDIFGNSKPILSLNRDDCIILPKTVSFDGISSAISYQTENKNQVAIIHYSYHGVDIGSASVDLAVTPDHTYSFDSVSESENEAKDDNSVIFVNIIKILIWSGSILGAAVVIFLIYKILKNYNIIYPHSRGWKESRRRRRHRKTRHDNNFSFTKNKDFDL